LTSPPRHQVPLTTGLNADAFYTSSYTGVLPEDILQDTYSSLSLAVLPRTLVEVPIPLPSDDHLTRTLSTFDRNSTVDGHKIGVIYVGPDQSKEADILANTYGSPDYLEFLTKLGTLIPLKGATFNTQGLDRSDDTDGTHTYAWRDRATEIVFHITTMMPTDLENNPMCINKKQHIGNDFVNVIWNDSGHEFNFDTFPSAFNYVYVVITPESDADFVALRKGKANMPSLAESASSDASPTPSTKNLFPCHIPRCRTQGHKLQISGTVRTITCPKCIILQSCVG
jgi:hypothetical protein